MSALNEKQIEFLKQKIYPYIATSNTPEERPEGEPPPPELLNREDYPEWSEYIGSMCADYEVSAVQAAEEHNNGVISANGEIAVKLVNILYVGE